MHPFFFSILPTSFGYSIYFCISISFRAIMPVSTKMSATICLGVNWIYRSILGFPGGSVVKNLPANADGVSIPGWERSPGERNSKPLQYSCLGNSTDREEPGRFQSIGLPKSWTRLSDFSVNNNNNSIDPLVE